MSFISLVTPAIPATTRAGAAAPGPAKDLPCCADLRDCRGVPVRFPGSRRSLAAKPPRVAAPGVGDRDEFVVVTDLELAWNRSTSRS